MKRKFATKEAEMCARITNYYFYLERLEFEQKVLNPVIEKLAELIYKGLN